MTNTPYQARKRFGQHFLVDQNVIHELLGWMHLQKNESVVEIGPGLGALTLPLLRTLNHLTAIELDRDVIPVLTAKADALRHKLDIISKDVLDVDFKDLQQTITPSGRLRVCGNLPYNISTPLIFHLLSYRDSIEDMHFMLQREVAERLAAPPKCKEYGRLTVMTQLFAKIELGMIIEPTAFKPPPKVLSALVKITPYKEPKYALENERVFATLVQTAFQQRRKMLRHSLKGIIPKNFWDLTAIQGTARPEELSIQDFVDLANALHRAPKN